MSKRLFKLSSAVGVAFVVSASTPQNALVSDWSNVETVIVSAHRPGPAMWHVVKGKSEVWILPTIAPMPVAQSWDTSQVANALRGATVLLTPPRGELGIFEGLWFWMTGMDALEQPTSSTLEQTLPDPLRVHFIAERTALHEDADRYSKYLPAVAGLMLQHDFLEANDLTTDEPRRTVERLAAHAGVPVRPVAKYPIMDVLNNVSKMSVQVEHNCLDDALGYVDVVRVHAASAAQAWTLGDLASLKDNYSENRFESCIEGNAAFSTLRERAIADTTHAVLAALDTPGKTVVIVPLGEFLKQKSILDHLVAAGATVTGPAN